MLTMRHLSHIQLKSCKIWHSSSQIQWGFLAFNTDKTEVLFESAPSEKYVTPKVRVGDVLVRLLGSYVTCEVVNEQAKGYHVDTVVLTKSMMTYYIISNRSLEIFTF